MHNNLYKKLEFDLILNKVAQKAVNSEVKKRIINTTHETSYKKIYENLNNTKEFMSLFFSYGTFKLDNFYNLLEFLDDKNRILEGLQLKQIAFQQSLIDNLFLYQNEISNKENYPFFINSLQKLRTIRDLSIEINHKINYEGIVYEDASEELISLNKQSKQINDKINSFLKDFISNNSIHLQENIVTYRNNRMVIPVKVASKNIIKGIIHDESSSKQTAFIEPSQIIEFNNQLQSIEYKIQDEIKKILEDLSNQVYEKINDILNNFEIIALLDLYQAKANYSIEINGVIPTINKDSAKLEIFEGRHPLIDKNEVVANDFFICNNDSKYRVVLISGSNTGGKTVALKMVGLFSLMMQSAIAISANEKSSLPVYSQIFVDIGDEQSIEQSLSTFSSHLMSIIKIIKQVKEYSLVLLDELGSGTDPREGENLALAIIEYLYQNNASVIATTHYSKLKNYALTNDYVRSASVEFDMESNKPKYKISFDTFASSNAFKIAGYLGLDKIIINKAIDYYNSDLNTSEELMLKLQNQTIIYKAKEDELNKVIKEYEDKYNKIILEEKRLEDKKESIIEKAKIEANSIVSRSQKDADKIINELKKQKQFINHEINLINKELDDLYFDTNTKVDNSKQTFNIGDLVEILKIKRQGNISKVLTNNQYEVIVGNMSMKVKHNEIKFLNKAQKINKEKISSKKIISSKATSEINLIGLRVEQANIDLSKFVDNALLNGLDQIRIIHGFGTGALREMTHNYLKKNKHVKEYHFAEYNQGGQGATIVVFK